MITGERLNYIESRITTLMADLRKLEAEPRGLVVARAIASKSQALRRWRMILHRSEQLDELLTLTGWEPDKMAEMIGISPGHLNHLRLVGDSCSAGVQRRIERLLYDERDRLAKSFMRERAE